MLEGEGGGGGLKLEQGVLGISVVLKGEGGNILTISVFLSNLVVSLFLRERDFINYCNISELLSLLIQRGNFVVGSGSKYPALF